MNACFSAIVRPRAARLTYIKFLSALGISTDPSLIACGRRSAEKNKFWSWWHRVNTASSLSHVGDMEGQDLQFPIESGRCCRVCSTSLGLEYSDLPRLQRYRLRNDFPGTMES